MTQRRPAARTLSRARRRRNNRRKLLIAGGGIILLAILLIVLLTAIHGRKDPPAQTAMSTVIPTTTATMEATPSPTPSPSPSPTPEPARAALRPTPAAGLLPIFASAPTEEKIIAITVDDCFQAENLQQIVDKAIECGGKLTIFPIGKNVLRTRHAEVLRYAWENGFELENHTFTHNGLYRCSDEELAQEIYMQNLALSYILGQEYSAHFLRPKGGDARRDQRIHAYCSQMGYYGVAHWSVSGSGSSVKQIAQSLAPGQIYLFHTTDSDLEKLLGFIPYATAQGYQLVTLNEMFGYPENETSELTVPIEEHVAPTLAPYQVVYAPYKKGSYAYGVKRIQDKMIELGYLDGEADGDYGDATANAVKAYQKDHGLEVTGEADVALQETLFGKDVLYPET